MWKSSKRFACLLVDKVEDYNLRVLNAQSNDIFIFSNRDEMKDGEDALALPGTTTSFHFAAKSGITETSEIPPDEDAEVSANPPTPTNPNECCFCRAVIDVVQDMNTHLLFCEKNPANKKYPISYSNNPCLCIHCRGLDSSSKCQYTAIIGDTKSNEMMRLDQIEAQKKYTRSQDESSKQKESFLNTRSIIKEKFGIVAFPDIFPYPRWMEQQSRKAKKEGGVNLTIQDYKHITSFMDWSKPKINKKEHWISTFATNGGWKAVILKLHMH